MTDELKALLEACLRQATKDGLVLLAVTMKETPPTIMFWRNTSDNKEQMAETFEILARDIRTHSMQEIVIGREN